MRGGVLRGPRIRRREIGSEAAGNSEDTMIGRREFLATTGAAVTVSTVGGASLPETVSVANPEKSARLFLPQDDLKPATFDRLPLEWHKQRAKRLQEKLAEDGRQGILLTDRWNIIYF